VDQGRVPDVGGVAADAAVGIGHPAVGRDTAVTHRRHQDPAPDVDVHRLAAPDVETANVDPVLCTLCDWDSSHPGLTRVDNPGAGGVARINHIPTRVLWGRCPTSTLRKLLDP